MSPSHPAEVLARLSAASSSTSSSSTSLPSGLDPTTTAATLIEIRDDIVGHEQKKAEWIRHGIVPHLLRIISFPFPSRRFSVTGSGDDPRPSTVRDDMADARLQAIIITGSLAHAGPAFIAPLLSTSIVVSLLHALNPRHVSPRLVLETLRTLNAIADALTLTRPSSALRPASLSAVLFSPAHVHRIRDVVGQTASTVIVQHQVSLAARLVARLCRDERHRWELCRQGILDALGARLAIFVVVPTSMKPEERRPQRRRQRRRRPSSKPSPSVAELHPILDAITSIISDSKPRALQLLRHVDRLAVLADATATTATTTTTTTTTAGNDEMMIVADASPPRPWNPIEDLLPQIRSAPRKVTSARKGTTSHPSQSPSLSSPSTPAANHTVDDIYGSSRPSTRRPPSLAVAGPTIADDADDSGGQDEGESQLVPWLIQLGRKEYGINRLMATSLLAELWRLGLVDRDRERLLALMVVPTLVWMLDNPWRIVGETSGYPPSNDIDWVQQTVRERGPVVLANLVVESVGLQKAAVEADAIKRLAQMLKLAFQPLKGSIHAPTWMPTSDPEMPAAAADDASPETRLGDPGLSPMLIHQLRVREGTLRALASLAPIRDEYRKKIIEQGVTPFMLESLKAYEETASSTATVAVSQGGVVDDMDTVMRSSSALMGNPTSVLVAACGLVQMLSRSVSILRTSLMDAGVTLPLFTLLTNPDMEVQISATAAVCNIVLDFSPMKEVCYYFFLFFSLPSRSQSVGTSFGPLKIDNHYYGVHPRLTIAITMI